MLRNRRNKNELLVLTGAIYSFVAYLTAFTLEVLFLVDLARQLQENEQQASISSPNDPGGGGRQHNGLADPTSSSDNNLHSRLNLEAMQAHITVSCLATAILYFVVFISSLILIVALILRSTFMLMIWMCAMTTLYLPEFGLVVYVSLYSWGLDTRNGQTEMVFYLFRAILNIIFITRAHKLFKRWNYEKNFIRLKTGLGTGEGFSSGAFGGFGTSLSANSATGATCFGAYDSPYFVSDSLSTTINPVFSSSTLNLNRYDHVRDFHHHQHHQTPRHNSPSNNSANGSLFSSSDYVSDYNNTSTASHHRQRQFPSPLAVHKRENICHPSRQQRESGRLDLATSSRASPSVGEGGTSGTAYTTNAARTHRAGSHDLDYHQNHQHNHAKDKRSSYHPQPTSRFYLGGGELLSQLGRLSSNSRQQQQQQQVAKNQIGNRLTYNSSVLSIEDDFPDYEMDIDYHTLNQRHHHAQGSYADNNKGVGQRASACDTMPGSSHDEISYSTQSLDRRQMKAYGMSSEQVVLRPLGHEPFEYLHRPGSISNLNAQGTPENGKRDFY